MAPDIELALLGAMTLKVAGETRPLPASRKTRALLAYLAVAERPERRDRLCDLLWEIPDDPRGALRWSLSKLRPLVDTDAVKRLRADRETAQLDLPDRAVDWRRLRQVVREGTASAGVDALRDVAWAAGEFLEGLEPAGCEGFRAWCIAQREDVRQWRIAVMSELSARPIDIEEAFSVIGPNNAPPLVRVGTWMNHLENDLASPIWRPWIDRFSMGRRLVRYDCRGVGVSDHARVTDADLFAADLENVADAAGLRAFDLYGFAQGAVAAVMFAARHPERVRRLVLQSSYALGRLLRGSPREIDRRKALITLATSGWKQDNMALRRMFSEFYIPGGTEAQRRSFDEFFQAVMAERNMSEMQHVLCGVDIRGCAEQITAPTLVLHSRGDVIIPLAAGQEVAKLIPGSRFVTLDSANHLLLDGEPAWERMVEAVEAFLE